MGSNNVPGNDAPPTSQRPDGASYTGCSLIVTLFAVADITVQRVGGTLAKVQVTEVRVERHLFPVLAWPGRRADFTSPTLERQRHSHDSVTHSVCF